MRLESIDLESDRFSLSEAITRIEHEIMIYSGPKDAPRIYLEALGVEGMEILKRIAGATKEELNTCLNVLNNEEPGIPNELASRHVESICEKAWVLLGSNSDKLFYPQADQTWH